MIAIVCTHKNYKKSGTNRNGSQRYKCRDCGKRFSDEHVNDGPLGNMRVDVDNAAMVLGMLLEGLSIRAASRLSGMDKDTICRLILEAGEKCQNFLDHNIVNVHVSDIQIDEIWSFVGMKAKQAKKQSDSTMGDSWTYIAIERNTKLILAHFVGSRDQQGTDHFLSKVRRSIDTTERFQLSSDGWGAYQYGVPFALGSKVDFGQLVKKYASQQETTRYSPATIISAEKKPSFGNPNPDKICTSHIESLNQKIRMHLRRFTRLTNAHSKTLAHHVAMQAIFFAFYNFTRFHSSLHKQTPAMAAGLANRPLKLVELLGQ